MKKIILAITCISAILALTHALPARSMLSTAATGETHSSPALKPGSLHLVHAVIVNNAPHRNCLNGGYGAPWARKSGYHVHGGGASKYGAPCTPYIKAPQAQTLPPGALQNPQLNKQ